MIKKPCSRCKMEKWLSEFHKSKNSKFGASSQCRLCHMQSQREYVEKFPERNRASKKRYRDKIKSSIYEKVKADRIHHHRAISTVSNARRAGILKNLPCVICGDPKTEAHHDSYKRENWLRVTFYCVKHHKAWHRVFTPEKPND